MQCRLSILVASHSVHCSPLRVESSAYYSYPYNIPPTEMEKNPAYAITETGQSMGSQNDEGNVMEHSYATIDARKDNIASYSVLSDENILQSASEPAYI